jgi:beta-xylosidase
LDLPDGPWADKQLWAPDAAEKDGKFYLFFPAKDPEGVFRIGVAISDTPDGKFTAEPTPINGTYSIDPAVLADTDGSYHLYFGGLQGGQLQAWNNNVLVSTRHDKNLTPLTLENRTNLLSVPTHPPLV